MRQDDAGLWLRAILNLIAVLFIEPYIALHRQVGGEIHARRSGQSRFERSKEERTRAFALVLGMNDEGSNHIAAISLDAAHTTDQRSMLFRDECDLMLYMLCYRTD